MASSNSSNSSSSYSNPPCAACKFLRRKCLSGCIFAPYFPPEEPTKFSNVHKIFGASNVSKLLNEIHPQQREDAVNSLAYEAEARLKDPVYGCVGAISVLQRQVIQLQKELDATNADLMRYTNDHTASYNNFIIQNNHNNNNNQDRVRDYDPNYSSGFCYSSNNHYSWNHGGGSHGDQGSSST
ncbi:LOB domain-containing protein 25-like [Andrographis paniculata]|uniref:LOB domain-containing protein 25-like n=1 Tax=Andrographis paniculata TaxID=175694 RepID=UPI0021E8B0E4|nr:LOB domain-containing protein 25-like [Andrographis paniculata]